jgi:26S proteasome regulatory subunit (ATPase 3-interacting protein)
MSKTTAANKKISLEYLQASNRPFSATDIQTNLDGKMGKAAVVNCLDELASESKISEKIYGKQKVYMALQSVDITNLKQEFRDLDEKIHIGKADLSRIKNENARIETQLKNFEGKVPLEDLQSQMADLNEQVNELTSRVNTCKSANTTLITKEEKAKTQKVYEKYAKDWRKLKRIANEMISTIEENCNMKKKQICEDLYLIMDEDENVKPPSI